MTKLKICGLTTLEDARFCAGAGADVLGFVQHPASPRYLPPEAARGIIDWIYGPETAGVFVDLGADAVNAACETAGFALAQLHGDEPPEVCAEIERPVIKALRVAPGDTLDALRRRLDPYRGHIAYLLLDAYHPDAHGGTGRVFDWDLAAALRAELGDELPLFLAGGLGAANVADAVRRVAPYGVDLSSSLEGTPGVKSFDKLNDFFDAWRDLLDEQETAARAGGA